MGWNAGTFLIFSLFGMIPVSKYFYFFIFQHQITSFHVFNLQMQ